MADCLAEPTSTRTALAQSSVTWTFQRVAQVAIDNQLPVDFESVVNPFKEA